MSFSAWEEHADSVNKKTSYHECPFSSTNMQSFHQKRAKILLVKKASKSTNPQNYPYSV